MNVNLDISTNGASKLTLGNVILAVLGAATVCGAYTMLAKLGAAFAVLVPYIAGGLLFLTLVGTFYFLLALLKNMRKTPKLRVSFEEGFTAVAVFTVMGFMATACMHAFNGTGNPLDLWNKAGMTAAMFTIAFGVARGVAELWKSPAK